jgi:hypothetical protein
MFEDMMSCHYAGGYFATKSVNMTIDSIGTSEVGKGKIATTLTSL